MTELKPCAHCGSVDVEGRESVTDYYVACCNCGARTGLVYLGPDDAANAAKKIEAIVAWNHRPGDETLARKVLEAAATRAQNNLEPEDGNRVRRAILSLNPAEILETK